MSIPKPRPPVCSAIPALSINQQNLGAPGLDFETRESTNLTPPELSS